MKKVQFFCVTCKKQYPKWMGFCAACQSWDSISEQEIQKETISLRPPAKVDFYHVSELENISAVDTIRYSSGIGEWDRVLGGGIVQGSFVLLAGDPGIGKSTLLLQVAHSLAASQKVLYISSEESVIQVNSRIKRIVAAHVNENLFVSYCCNVSDIISLIDQVAPDIVVIDSIQNCQIEGDFLTMHGSGIRNAAHAFLAVAKEKNRAIIVTGHITKDGAVAGPKTLEHVVDAVIHLHGEDGGHLRTLRASKNRFGSTEEVGFFTMNVSGMVEQINECDSFIENCEPTIGSALTCITEGSRNFIVEIQALTIPVKYGNPQRVITGIDHKQLILISAVLERYLRIPLHSQDIFCKVSGGIKIKQTLSNAALAFAIVSSFLEKKSSRPLIITGEVGLTGSIALPSGSQFPYSLLKKYGIESIACPDDEIIRSESFKQGIELYSLQSVQDLVKLLKK